MSLKPFSLQDFVHFAKLATSSKTNSGGTDEVWFYDMEADGFSLDDKRTELDHSKHENDNLLDILKRWKNRVEEKKRPRTAQSFTVPKAEIAEKGYDLSINRYKEVVYEQKKLGSPQVILAELKDLERVIQKEMDELEAMLS